MMNATGTQRCKTKQKPKYKTKLRHTDTQRCWTAKQKPKYERRKNREKVINERIKTH